MNWPLFFVNSQIRLSMDTNTAQKGWTFGLKSHLRRDGSVKHVRLLRPLGERAGDQQLTDGWAVRSQAWLFSPLGCFLQTLSDMCTERRPTRGLQLQPSPPREKTSSTEAHLRFKPLYQLFFFFLVHTWMQVNHLQITCNGTQEHIYTHQMQQTHTHTHTTETSSPLPQLNSLFWQSTGQPEHWRQKQAHENTGSLGGWGSYAHLHSLACN